MKKIFVFLLCVFLLFVSCEQKNSSNSPTHTQAQETPQPSCTPTINENADIVGFSLANSTNGEFIVSDLFGIKTGVSYIDDVSTFSVNGKQIGNLLDEGDFLDNLTDAKIDNIKNCSIYLINKTSVIKGNISQTDVLFEQGTGEFFIKIHSTFLEELQVDSTNKYICVLANKDIEIQLLDHAAQADAVKPLCDDECELSLFNLIKVDNEVYCVWKHKWDYAEAYSINDQQGSSLLTLSYSEP